MGTLPNIGFIDLDNQCGPMAERITAAGYPLTVWPRRCVVLAQFVSQGTDAATQVAALGVTCDVVAVCAVDNTGLPRFATRLSLPCDGVAALGWRS